MKIATPFLEAHILVIDDVSVNLTIVKEILGEFGYQNVACYDNGREGIKYFKRQAVDLIILDIMMPEMDGFEVLQSLAEAVPGHGVPVLVVTAKSDRETRMRALTEGAQDFLSKPFDASEAIARITNMLRIRQNHTQLESLVAERTREVREAQEEIIRRLGRAAEFRDNETGLHIVRISHFAALLARQLRQNEAFVERLFAASPMHDVGKIGVPDHVLLKPGKLDHAERAIIETHSSIGADLLGGHSAPVLQLAAEIALTHHEKWDGSGYPRGLKHEEIPLSGRIVAIVDVFDALTSVRCYKKSWSNEQALEHIQSQSGHHFDPIIVQAFIDSWPAITKLRKLYDEPVKNEKKQILVVDDEAQNRLILREILEMFDYDVIEAEDGFQALQILHINADQICLTLLDWMMPGKNGLEVLSEMRANPALNHIPVVLQTARAMVSEVRKAKEAGALAVLLKPFDADTLYQTVTDAIGSPVEGI